MLNLAILTLIKWLFIYFLHNIYSFSQEKADFNNGGNMNILFNSLLVQINKKQCRIFAAHFGEIIIGRKST